MIAAINLGEIGAVNADKGTIQTNCAQIAESNSKANIPTNGIGRKKQKYGLVSL